MNAVNAGVRQDDTLIALASSLHAGPNRMALLLGSGISAAAGVPTGWEVSLDLVRRLAVLQGEGEPSDPLAWYQGRYGDDPDYSKMLERLAPSPETRRDLLEAYFVPTAEDREVGRKVPTAAHRAIARLVAKGYVKVIVTTNFDRLTEAALQEVGIDPIVIADANAAAGAIPLAHARAVVVKVHGDYLNADIRNTVAELDHYDAAMDRLLNQIFDEYGLVVCGWSGEWDEALRAALSRATSRRYGTYFAVRGELAQRARDLLLLRQGVEVPIADADQFFTSLVGKVDALEDLAGRRTLSTAVAVAQAKRYMVRPEGRISLFDLLTQQAELTAGLDLPAGEPVPGDDTIKERVSIYDASAATLISLVATVAFYAVEPEHDRLLAEVFRRLVRRRPVQTGETYIAWTSLRRYPAVLALYTLGLGALAARRIDSLLYCLTNVTVPDGQSRDESPLAVGLASWRPFYNNEVAKAAFGDKTRRTPTSDLLHERLRDAVGEILPDDSDYDRVFNQLEYLLSVVCFDQYGHAPIGRFAWQSLFDLPDEPVRQYGPQMVNAGLFSGSVERLEEVIAKYNESVTQSGIRF